MAHELRSGRVNVTIPQGLYDVDGRSLLGDNEGWLMQ